MPGEQAAAGLDQRGRIDRRRLPRFQQLPATFADALQQFLEEADVHRFPLALRWLRGYQHTVPSNGGGQRWYQRLACS
ncbi:hypothetical protein D3C76_1649770 [compost metagenome]